jgi:hypothetical protein
MLIDKRLTNYLEDNGLRSKYQGGFRPGRGTAEQVFILNHLVETAKHRRQPLHCAFVDFRKAFDTVRHSHLWERLQTYGITGNVLSCIRSLYAQSAVAVNVNGQYTDFVKVLIGVRQGDPLSPTLFGLFIEVLEQYITQAVGPQWEGRVPDLLGIALSMLLYADDVVLMAHDAATLQQQLDALSQFCKDWDMTVNLVKTKVVSFGMTPHQRQQQLQRQQWQFDGQAVQQVDSYKYLGVIFHAHDGIMQAPVQLAEAGRRALFAVQGMCYSQDITDPSIRLHLWQQLVLPVVSYGSEIWGPQFMYFMEPLYFRDNPGEQIHLQFLRWYTGASGTTHTQIILKAGNRLPLVQHWLRRALQLWNKLSTVDPDSWLAHAAFLSNIQLWQGGCNTCWAARVMAHMQQLGLSDMIDSQQPFWSQQFDPDSVEMAMDATMESAWTGYQQRPYRQLGAASCEGRTLFCYAQYFLNINSSACRRHVYHNVPASAWRPVMQLATGRLRLHSVTAHWHGSQRSNSSCCPCCPGTLEDPAHYVLECPAYSTIRYQYACIVQAEATAAQADVSQAMLQLFVPANFLALAAYLRKAYQLRFQHGAAALIALAGANRPAVLQPVGAGDGTVTSDVAADSSSSDNDSDDYLD